MIFFDSFHSHHECLPCSINIEFLDHIPAENNYLIIIIYLLIYVIIVVLKIIIWKI